jgi:hypothetical protein
LAQNGSSRFHKQVKGLGRKIKRMDKERMEYKAEE